MISIKMIFFGMASGLLFGLLISELIAGLVVGSLITLVADSYRVAKKTLKA